MKRSSSEAPYLSVCIIARNCELSLPGGFRKCLVSVRARVPDAEIVVVDTMSNDDDLFFIRCLLPDFDLKKALEDIGIRTVNHLDGGGFIFRCLHPDLFHKIDAELEQQVGRDNIVSGKWAGTVEIAQEFADVFDVYKGPNGDWSREMPWFDDAAAARQRSFELAHGVWRMWIDADDVLLDPETAGKVLEKNGQLTFVPMGSQTRSWAGEKELTLTDALRLLEKNAPSVNYISCPYFYRASDKDPLVAAEFQERERIVKWADGFHWKEAAHEVLVPLKAPSFETIGKIAKLIFYHNKRWTYEDHMTSYVRHYGILKNKYLQGDRSSRTLRYLFNLCQICEPSARGAYLNELLTCAQSKQDRMLAQLAKAEHCLQSKLYWDGLEACRAAELAVPNVFNVAKISAQLFEGIEEWENAAAQWKKAASVPYDTTVSAQDPKDRLVTCPINHIECLLKLGAWLTHAVGDFQKAHDVYRDAYVAAIELGNTPQAKGYSTDIVSLGIKSKNHYNGSRIALEFDRQAQHLADSDEPLKIIQLIRALPWDLEDHPLKIKWEKIIEKLNNYVEGGEDAQAAYYASLTEEHGAVFTTALSSDWTDYNTCAARARRIIDWIKNEFDENDPVLIFEIGTYDGITAVPIMKACPNVRYVGYDFSQRALDELQRNLEKFVPGGVNRFAGYSDRFAVLQHLNRERNALDAVVWHEVIEHMPDPIEEINTWLHEMSSMEAINGRTTIFWSTPWGAFDKGSPPNLGFKRDVRGHVMALTPKRFVDIMDQCNLVTVECNRNGNPNYRGYADTLHATTHMGVPAEQKVAFVVPSSLWPWNGSLVHETGIGASEETIVYLAEHLAGQGIDVSVYGIVNEEEVKHQVKYYNIAKIRHITPETRIVVSRAPGFIKTIQSVLKHHNNCPMFLWLQDAEYDDLNDDVASQYEKVVVLTDWHREEMHKKHGVARDRMVTCNNFLLPHHFNSALNPVEREPHRFIYSSSPDRGLINILGLWSDILKKWPDATLHIFYGWEGFAKIGSQRAMATFRVVRQQFDALKHQKGIIEHGRVNHIDLAKEMMKSSVWFYPTNFAETGCLTAAKVQAAGCPGVCTRYAGLAETADGPWIQWLDYPCIYNTTSVKEESIIKIEKAFEMDENERIRMADSFTNKFDILNGALGFWLNLLCLDATE